MSLEEVSLGAVSLKVIFLPVIVLGEQVLKLQVLQGVLLEVVLLFFGHYHRMIGNQERFKGSLVVTPFWEGFFLLSPTLLALEIPSL
jgi:hypothetical protein